MKLRTPIKRCTTSDYVIEDILEIEDLGVVETDVYDLEVSDHHNFFANNILVHNSVYVQEGYILEHLGLDGREATEFIIRLYNEFMRDYLSNCFVEYAKKTKCVKNIQDLELEKIASTVVMYAKKNYIMVNTWKVPDIFIDEYKDITFKGIEIVKSSFPSFSRTELQKITLWMIRERVNKTLNQSQIIDRLKDIRKRLAYQDPSDICRTCRVNGLETRVQINVAAGNIIFAPYTYSGGVRGSAYFNLIIRGNKSFLKKYKPITSGEKVKYYESTDPSIPHFAFRIGEFPSEFAPPIDYDHLFDKIILSPVNRFLDVIGLPEIPLKYITLRIDTSSIW